MEKPVGLHPQSSGSAFKAKATNKSLLLTTQLLVSYKDNIILAMNIQKKTNNQQMLEEQWLQGVVSGSQKLSVR
jgi:hypothetical protein